MPADDIPKLAEWLAEYRSRPDPVEVVVESFDLVDAAPNDPSQGRSAGQVAVVIVRYETPGKPGQVDDAHYVMGVNEQGDRLWDDWHESEQAAREAIADKDYGAVVERPLGDD